MTRSLVALLALGSLAGAASAAVPPKGSIDGLVEQLASPAYQDREEAGRELLKMGMPALVPLEKAAAQHPDPEARQRAGLILVQLKRSLDTSKFLPPKTVKLDYNQMPLGTAVADLKAKTGALLVLDQQRVADPLRPVTVKTDEMPAWAAIDAFCIAAGLKEVFREELGTPASTPQAMYQTRRSSYAMPANTGLETAAQVPIVLVDGKADLLPGDRNSVVRVLALPHGFSGHKVVRGSGQVVFNLDVTPLPSIKWEDVTSVRIHRAEDETGRPVTLSQRTESSGGFANSQMDGGVVFLGGGPGQVMMWNGDVANGVSGSMTRPNPRIVPVVLKTDDRSIQKLNVFEGTVVGEVTLTNQTLVHIEDLAKAVGTTATAPGDTRVTIVHYKVEAANRLVVKVRVDSPNPYTLQRMNRRMAFAAANGWDDGSLRGNASQVKFLDADDKVIPQPSTRSSSGSDDGVRQVNETEYVFNHRPGVKDPVKLQLLGNKPVTVEIPFKMKDVMLP